MRRLAGYLAFVVLLASGVGVVTLLRIRRAAYSESLEAADAIVVFGAAVWESGPSVTLRTRVQRAAELYAQGRAPVVVCSGGVSNGRSEPKVMAELLEARGVPPSAIVLDESGVNTRATVRALHGLGGGRWRTVLVVSSPFHVFRIEEECRRHAIRAIACPAHRTARHAGRARLRVLLWDARQYGREMVAVWTYRVAAWARRASASPR